MKFEKSKILQIFFVLSAVCFLLFLGLSLFYFGRGAYHGALKQNRIVFSLTDENSRELVLSDSVSNPLPKGERTLLLSSGEDETVSFAIYQKGVQQITLKLEPRQKREILLESDGSALSLVARTGGAAQAFLSDLESFDAVHPSMKQGGDLFFLSETEIGGAFLSAPFRLFGDFSFDELSIESKGTDDIVLYPQCSFEGTLFVSAPEGRVYWRNFHPTYDSEDQNFYLKAKKVNDKRLSLTDYPITSFCQLSLLASENHLPRLFDGAELCFTKPITVEESLCFSALVKIRIREPVDFSGNTLRFSSEREGTFEVHTSMGVGVDAASLLFSAPHSALLWTGDGTVPAISTVAKGSNVKTYNGTVLPLGGEGTAVPKLRVFSEGNEYLTDDVDFTVSGNCLTASLPYLMTKQSLNEAKYSLSCEQGSVTLVGNLSDGVIVTEDFEGKQRRFCVDAARDPYQIPVVHLETEGQAEITSKSQYVSGTFAFDGGETDYTSLRETHVRIRGRGNSSWKWEKKPYKLHFDEPTSLLGLPAAEEWALFSNYADKSLMRNRLAQVMASKLSFAYCPTQVCVDVFLNGEYLGVYTLGEHLEAGEGRVEVSYDPSRTDCGYFLEAGGVVSGVDVKGMNYFHAGLVKFVLIKMPEYQTMTSEQFEFIHQYMLAADEAVKKGEGYEEYLDVDSVIDWLIMIELSCNTDCTWRRSTYFTKEPGGKLVMGPVWDFDLAFGNFSKDNHGDNTWVSSEPDDDYVGETWSTHLLEDPEFQARFRKRWQEVRDVLLETAMTEIEEQYRLLSPSAELNFKRWDILGKKVAFERHDTKNYRTYSSQIYYLEDFINNRVAWMDEQMMNFA